jgi:hypothetical protein
MTESGAVVVKAEKAELEDCSVVFLSADQVSGEVDVLFDVKAAVIFGVVVGAVLGLIRLLTGRKE